MAIKPVISNHW